MKKKVNEFISSFLSSNDSYKKFRNKIIEDVKKNNK